MVAVHFPAVGADVSTDESKQRDEVHNTYRCRQSTLNIVSHPTENAEADINPESQDEAGDNRGNADGPAFEAVKSAVVVVNPAFEAFNPAKDAGKIADDHVTKISNLVEENLEQGPEVATVLEQVGNLLLQLLQLLLFELSVGVGLGGDNVDVVVAAHLGLEGGGGMTRRSCCENKSVDQIPAGRSINKIN